MSIQILFVIVLESFNHENKYPTAKKIALTGRQVIRNIEICNMPPKECIESLFIKYLDFSGRHN